MLLRLLLDWNDGQRKLQLAVGQIRVVSHAVALEGVDQCPLVLLQIQLREEFDDSLLLYDVD